jgi:hypothetical protein
VKNVEFQTSENLCIYSINFKETGYIPAETNMPSQMNLDQWEEIGGQ